MQNLVCGSCKKEITNTKGSTIFFCPNCGKGQIVRCFHCRELGTRYKCPSCEFTGPN